MDEVAPSSAPILITGETGVGKDLVARAIHLRSQRSFGPFVAVNCGALSESLLESELFGHEKGAFTGAVKTRRGCLEMADNGTLFLDEIGEISTKMQISLLRVLEEKRFLRLGGSNSVSSDFRLITATHRDLPPLIKENQFREDFYYRINVITIHIPPLRERKEDIPVLSDHFLKRYVEETGKHLEGFTAKALEQLTSYSWPGNVRELKNVIERAVVIARGRMIGTEELKFLDPGKAVSRSIGDYPGGSRKESYQINPGLLRRKYQPHGEKTGYQPEHSIPKNETIPFGWRGLDSQLQLGGFVPDFTVVIAYRRFRYLLLVARKNKT